MTGKPFAAMREKNAQMWKEIFVEDIDVVERMQKGRHAPSFDGGKFFTGHGWADASVP
jgi:hypothetical protein